MKKTNKKGFTLAELLVVVAIIAVLVAIAIPIFTAQLEKAREATDAANLRAAYAELAVDVLNDGKEHSEDVVLTQTVEGWASVDKIAEVSTKTEGFPSTGTVTVKVDKDGKVTFSAKTGN